MKKTIIKLVLVGSGLGLVSGQTISNASFETNNWDTGITVSSELSATDNYVDYDKIVASPWNLSKNGIFYTKAPGGTSDGRYAAEVLFERGSVSQTLSFASAGTYAIGYDSFTLAKQGVKYEVSVTGSLGGTPFSLIEAELGNDAAWTTRTHSFAISDTSQSYELAFTNLTDGTPLYLDNFKMKQTGNVPEPSAALLGGLGGLLLLTRRQRME